MLTFVYVFNLTSKRVKKRLHLARSHHLVCLVRDLGFIPGRLEGPVEEQCHHKAFQ